MELIDVVAGIIFDESKKSVLIALRKPDQHQGNRWEFPGGKMEANEAQSDALSRELLEEINVTVIESQHRQTLEHQYTDKHVRLHFWDVTAHTGHAQGLEGQKLRWVEICELHKLVFPEANQPIVDQLVTSISHAGILR